MSRFERFPEPAKPRARRWWNVSTAEEPRRTWDAADALILLGLALVVAGIALVSKPVALIVGGLVLVALAIFQERRPE